jgi:DNA invertase Pin-like site-specific DNA recombinase
MRTGPKRSRIPPGVVRRIRNAIRSSHLNKREIARAFGVAGSTVGEISREMLDGRNSDVTLNNQEEDAPSNAEPSSHA